MKPRMLMWASVKQSRLTMGWCFGKRAPTVNLGNRLEEGKFGKNVISQNYNVVFLT